MKKATIVGLGYVGLPLAVLAREKGWAVAGLDVNPDKVAQINEGISPIDGDAVARNLKKYPIVASTDPVIVADSDVIVIAVPTPVTKDNLPDLEPIKSAITSIRSYLHAGHVLIVESTINPGVMDEVVLPLLTEVSLPLEKDGADEVLVVAHCPERINPGDPKWSVRNIPRVIGGYSEAGVAAAAAFYESILEAPVMRMATIMEAEAVKILENTFRDINIAFINEMAKSFARIGIDITRVIAGASTKPFAFLPHFPGNGVGGHCISVDPYYMIERGRQAGFDHQFLKLARQINDSMPGYTVELLERGLQQIGMLPEQAHVALLGLAYKKDIGDLRESPALEVRRLLAERGLITWVYDPFVPEQSTVPDLASALRNAHVVMLATNHTALVEGLTTAALVANGIQVVIDGKNALDGENIAAAGIPYYGVGRHYLPK